MKPAGSGARVFSTARIRRSNDNTAQKDSGNLLIFFLSSHRRISIHKMENSKMELFTNIYLGDSREVLTQIPDNSVDLIFTSPPYADRRKGTYGGIHPDHYVQWFLPISKELLRVMKPTGTFILNIKEKAVDGERHTYVIELILEMRKQGWFWTEEFIWHKKNSYPGKWPNRFRDAWERLIQFNKQKQFAMYQERVMVPVGSWSENRLSLHYS